MASASDHLQEVLTSVTPKSCRCRLREERWSTMRVQTIVLCRERFCCFEWVVAFLGGGRLQEVVVHGEKNMGQCKTKVRTDCGLLFLGLENNGTIVVRSPLHGENNSPQSAFQTGEKI